MFLAIIIIYNIFAKNYEDEKSIINNTLYRHPNSK